MSTAAKVLLTRPLPNKAQQMLLSAAKAQQIELISRDHDSAAERSWLLGQLKGQSVNGILCMLGDKMDNELLEAAGSSLKTVSTMSAGYDHVDIDALKKRGITFGTTPDALTDATADIGAMLVLMATRRAGEGIRAVVDGKWPSMPWSPLLLCGHGIQNATVGILGFGKIGQLTLKRLLGFGIGKCLYTTSKVGTKLPASKDYFNLLSNSAVPIEPAQSYEQLAAESDVLITCCSLTNETKGIIGADFLKLMKPTAYVVNTARGPVVDSDALADAIEQGKLAGAGLDVVTGEPNITPDHRLVKNEKVVLLPHIGSATYETRTEMAVQSVQNLFAGLGIQGATWANKIV